MTSDQWDAWMALPAERRQQAVTIRDAKIVGFVQTHMQTFWQLDLHTGCPTFDAVQFPLLSAMQFVDVTTETDKFPTHEISWPEMFHADPTWIPLVVDQTLGRHKHPRKLLPPGQWRFQLLRQQPQSWPDLERCIARLVEQLVLRVASEPSASSGAAAQNSDLATMGSAAAVPLTARAAKRLRQRERRKLCKRGILAAPGTSGTLPELPEACDVSEEEKMRPLEEDVGSEASASTAVGSRLTLSWADCSQEEEEGSIEDDLPIVDRLSSLTPSSELLPPLSPQGCRTPRDLWPATPDSSPRLGCRNDVCLASLPPLLLPPSIENCLSAPGVWINNIE